VKWCTVSCNCVAGCNFFPLSLCACEIWFIVSSVFLCSDSDSLVCVVISVCLCGYVWCVWLTVISCLSADSV